MLWDKGGGGSGWRGPSRLGHQGAGVGCTAVHLAIPCVTWAMRQRKLGSHTPPCHRRMVITTLFSVLLAALQRRPVLYHTRCDLGGGGLVL